MTDDREAIVALITKRMARLHPFVTGRGSAFDYRYDELESLLRIISNGDHHKEPSNG